MRRSNTTTAISAAFFAAALCLGWGLCGSANAAATIFTPSNTPPPEPGVSVPAAQHAAPPAPTPTPAAAPAPAAAAAVAASPAPQAAPTPAARPAPRRRSRAARRLPPLKVCKVQVNAPKGVERAAALGACLKE